MEIKIDVDETKFKDILEKELEAFSSEELHEIIKEMLKKYLMEDTLIKSLFVTEGKDRYGYSRDPQPTLLLMSAVKSVDINKDLEEIKDKIVSTITADNAITQIIEGLVVKAIAGSLFDSRNDMADKWFEEAYYRRKSYENNNG